VSRPSKPWFDEFVFAAIWLWTILFRGQSCRPYNVGSEQDIRIGELAMAVAQAFRPEPDVRVREQAVAGRAGDRYVPSTRRAASELRLDQAIGLQEAISRTILRAESQ
jgi:dTDP-glucose 4,6-dehydratase